MVRKRLSFGTDARIVGIAIGVMLILCGCAGGPTTARRDLTPLAQGPLPAEPAKVFELKAISSQQAAALLTELGLGKVSIVPGRNAVAMAGPASVQNRGSVVVDLVDVNEPYAVQVLAPVFMARDIPSNDRIAEALGNIAICTFASSTKCGSWSSMLSWIV
jgi:hypothetical protein